jgi:hypothetical protein
LIAHEDGDTEIVAFLAASVPLTILVNVLIRLG